MGYTVLPTELGTSEPSSDLSITSPVYPGQRMPQRPRASAWRMEAATLTLFGSANGLFAGEDDFYCRCRQTTHKSLLALSWCKIRCCTCPVRTECRIPPAHISAHTSRIRLPAGGRSSEELACGVSVRRSSLSAIAAFSPPLLSALCKMLRQDPATAEAARDAEDEVDVSRLFGAFAGGIAGAGGSWALTTLVVLPLCCIFSGLALTSRVAT